jgi:hypothetical protein
MLRRVTPRWRLIGQCYLSDLEDRGRLSQAALSVYHEIHIVDGPRPGSSRARNTLNINDALLKIRKVQADHDRTSPIVMCCRQEKEGVNGRPSVELDARTLDKSRPVSVAV